MESSGIPFTIINNLYIILKFIYNIRIRIILKCLRDIKNQTTEQITTVSQNH